MPGTVQVVGCEQNRAEMISAPEKKCQGEKKRVDMREWE